MIFTKIVDILGFSNIILYQIQSQSNYLLENCKALYLSFLDFICQQDLAPKHT